MAERDEIRRAYDAIAAEYAATREEAGRDVAILESFLATVPSEPTILDAGCGQGTPILDTIAASTDGVGVDFSRAQLRLAREHAFDVPLVQGDITQLPFGEDVFDAITSYHTLIHVPLDDHRTVLAEFARVLRPDGHVLVSEGPSAWSGTNPDWLDTGVEMQWDIAGADTTRSQFRDAGFTVVDEWSEAGDEEWVFFVGRLNH